MTLYHKLIKLSLFLALLLAACSAPGPPSPTGDTARPRAAAQRVLTIANFGEPPQLAVKTLVTQGGALGIPSRFFNATFDMVDTREVTHPMLVEALPELNTETWKLNPDGTMETRYTLKPNLTWHDGTPLHAEDFVFAFRVYKTPELGQATSRPIGQMEEVLAPDARTIIIRWSQPYAEAHTLGIGFQGLPRHLLEADFRNMDAVGFTNHPFWTIDYVGLGPYKLDRWEPGAFLTGSAFENFALGRPKIDQIRIAFINDPQTALANVLAGEIHHVGNFMFAVTQGLLLGGWCQTDTLREWAEPMPG